MLKSDFHLRCFSHEDIEHVLEMELLSYTEPWTEEILRDELKPMDFKFNMIAEDTKTGDIAAYCFYWIIETDEIHINNIVVHPNYRRRGLATMLIHECIRQGQERGIYSITLEVRQSNANAQNLYRRLGFEVEGKRFGYYKNPSEDALIMRLRTTPPKNI